jgi:calcineurin-like phosphoesterase family protein
MKIILEKNQNIYFTSDTHYSHVNICRGTTNWKNSDDMTRDFSTLEEMNETLINNINNKVGENDILFHLGDWSFNGFENIKIFRNKINCKNIHLLLGNHDHHIERNKHDIRKIFSSVNYYCYLTVVRPNNGIMDKYSFVCIHYPIASWNNIREGVIHLHGHVHLPENLRLGPGRSIDVGVDGNNLEPISLDEILKLMNNRKPHSLILPKDHHI